ncbi:hypothetical protein V9T40_003583 [Parthenolecanium corni]|uniref:Uncharacterized protein n=1 Tax=Parthenolecanium corni TaxID=536013 RepID=A0AAN9U181_9HEMI
MTPTTTSSVNFVLTFRGEETKLTTIESIQTHRGSVSPSTYLIASYYLAFVTVMGTSFNIVVIYVILTDIKVITENLTLRCP